MLKLVVLAILMAVGSHGYANGTNDDVKVSYYLYTRYFHRYPVGLLPNRPSLEASPIDNRLNTVIIIHGHRGSAFTSLNPAVKDALLTAENLNVIVIDWSEHASLSYTEASNAVPRVADKLLTLYYALRSVGIYIQTLHLVGFDLGAHVAGITGRIMGNGLGRITGLDPSGNGWGFNSKRLRITDARYVEVIHTDGKGVLAYGVGTPLGHVDFFANGGSNQPGCLTHACSHDRAYELFAASMINPSLIGYSCSSNTQLNLNLCRGNPLRMGTTALNKLGIPVNSHSGSMQTKVISSRPVISAIIVNFFI